MTKEPLTETKIVQQTKTFPLHEIVEVQEGGYRLANKYLDHGYVLLAVVEWATMTPPIPSKDGVDRVYSIKDARYVVGRTKDVLPIERPAYKNGKAAHNG